MAAEHDINERTVIERRDPLLGQVFDRRFQVEAKIASGGFGSIYRATHLKSGHPFALKVLHHNLTSDPRVVARFRREGAALTKLRDPHTITAYEIGETPDGMLYILMELLRGESLFERLRARGALPWPQAIAIARAVCSSLAEAHSHGIIHRDLKPTNIHLEPGVDGAYHVKVLDFGIAKIVQDSDIDSSDLTHAGQMIGTLDYMSPEQMVGGMCTATSDIYTLGIVMYEMIAGRRPFDSANSPAAALAAVLTTTPERLSIRAVVPPEVDRIVMRCLERQHGDRFPSAREVAVALDDILVDRAEVVTRLARSVPGPVSSFESVLATTKPLPGLTVRAREPASASPPIDHDATLIGPLPPVRPATTPRHHAIGSSPTANSLRAAYPTIHRPPPSPMRPPTPSPFDDRPGSSAGAIQRHPAPAAPAAGDGAPTAQPDAFRRLTLAISVAIAIIAAFVIATQL